MSGFRSIEAFLRRLRRSTARSTCGSLAVGSSSTSSISLFSRKPCSSSTSPSSSSTSARATATSAYVSTPVWRPLATSSLTSSSSCSSATDIPFLGVKQDPTGPRRAELIQPCTRLTLQIVKSSGGKPNLRRLASQPTRQLLQGSRGDTHAVDLSACPRRGYEAKHVDQPLWRLYPDRRRLDSFPMTDDGGVLG